MENKLAKRNKAKSHYPFRVSSIMNDTEYLVPPHGCNNHESSTSCNPKNSIADSIKSVKHNNGVIVCLSEENFKKDCRHKYPLMCIRSSPRDKPRLNARNNWNADDLSIEVEVDHVAELLGYKQEEAELEVENKINESVWLKRKRAAAARSQWLSQPLFRNTPCVASMENIPEGRLSIIGGVLDEHGFPSGKLDVKDKASSSTTTMWWMDF